MQRFAADIEKTLSASPVILSSNIQKQFGPDNETVYIKGTVVFVDSSVLELALFAGRSRGKVAMDKYRYHYQDAKGDMIFRYDNAPHHREVTSFPHHKHLPGKVTETSQPSAQDLLNEISAVILGK